MDKIPKRSRLGILAGWLTVAGLALIVVAIVGHGGPHWRSSLWLYLLCLGVVCSLLGGVTWTHTRGKRTLKTAFLGLMSGAIGAALGALLGEQVESSAGRWEREFLAVVCDFWVGAILFGSLGVWWGMRITRRLSAPPYGSLSRPPHS